MAVEGLLMKDFEVSISDVELKTKVLSAENLSRAKKSLLNNGFVALNNLFSYDQILKYRVTPEKFVQAS
jgi:hypothetical protein